MVKLAAVQHIFELRVDPCKRGAGFEGPALMIGSLATIPDPAQYLGIGIASFQGICSQVLGSTYCKCPYMERAVARKSKKT